MGSVLLLEETPNSFLPCENTVSEKTASCKPGEEPSPRTTSASSLILDFSASITEISEREMSAAQATQSMAFSYSSKNAYHVCVLYSKPDFWNLIIFHFLKVNF